MNWSESKSTDDPSRYYYTVIVLYVVDKILANWSTHVYSHQNFTVSYYTNKLCNQYGWFAYKPKIVQCKVLHIITYVGMWLYLFYTWGVY